MQYELGNKAMLMACPAGAVLCMQLLKLCLFHRQVNISELGLVTQSGKVVWGESANILCRTSLHVVLLSSANVP